MKVFNEDMTFFEAQSLCLSLVAANPEDTEKIIAAYEKVLPVVVEKMCDKARKGWLC